mmetsp:Transcript_63422/g.160490  ORF Transcript_63422/g.160490 Transcript_63422/m.160490 type:complete len:620 (+) Transcript_63422:65-1924(+)
MENQSLVGAAAASLDSSQHGDETVLVSDSEAQSLAQEGTFDAVVPAAGAGHVARRPWRFLAIATTLLGAAMAVALIASTGAPCMLRHLSASTGRSRLPRMDEYPEDLISLAQEAGGAERWLEAASAAGAAAEDDAADGREEVQTAALHAIEDAMQERDPDKAKRVVDRAMSRAIMRAKARRRAIKKHLKKGQTTTPRPLSPGEGAKLAACVVRVGYATSIVAGIASDWHDAAVTCPGVDPLKAFAHNNTRGQICGVNVGLAVTNMVTLSAVLSSVAEDCTASLIPNMDTLCASAVTGFITAFSQFAGTGVLFAALCGPHHKSVPPGVAPSNLGDKRPSATNPNSTFPYLDFKGWTPGIDSSPAPGAGLESSGSAPGRRLLFGGGKGSTAVQCYVDVTDAAWFLAQAGLAISSASGHTGLLGGCPPKNILGGQEVKGPIYRWAEGYCAVDISSIISFLAATAAFLQFAVVNCADTLQLNVICGAAIAGVTAAGASVAQTATGLNLACDEFQKPALKGALEVGRSLDLQTDGALSAILGRRLGDLASDVGVEAEVAALKKRFASPEDVWRSIGMDLDDAHASWREVHISNPPSPSDVLGMLEEDKQSDDIVGLFGASQTCS